MGPSGAFNLLVGSPSKKNVSQALTRELAMQRAKSPRGPRIAATLDTLDGFESGVTLVIADADKEFGIITLRRSAELGPFTSSEISMLTFAVAAGSDRGSSLRLQPLLEDRQTVQSDTSDADDSPAGAYYVFNGDFEIVLAWDPENSARQTFTDHRVQSSRRLPCVLEESIRQLTASWSPESVNKHGVANPISFLTVRTHPLLGPAGLHIGVRIDRTPIANSLTNVAARYRISPREVQVLALLLDGNHLDEIGKRLYITSSTVQDHIKSMLDKTESRNRTELIARVLGWFRTNSHSPQEGS